MAVNAYLLIKDRPGPSTSKKDAIDIQGFSFDASQSKKPGTAGSSGQVDMGYLTVQKVLDKTSPLLFEDCATGTVLKEVTLTYDKPIGNAPADYFKIELTDAVISIIQLSGSHENPQESVSFAFKKIKVSYSPENPDGKSLAGFIAKGFDMTTLKAF